MTPDSELLRRFAKTNSEDAFAELVERHANLVYSAALRQVNGDEHLAKDVAQMVFADLARKASSLSRRESLTGWLYTSTHFAAVKIVRGENRRRDREIKSMREPIQETGPDPDWEKLRTTLDAAMHELKETDREAVLLRYFENRQFAEVGAKLGLNENAARMRVERALEKLRDIFTKRGVTTATALASVISANAIQIAPANLAATLTTASMASAGTGTFTLLKIMTATKLKLAFSAIVVAGAVTAFMVQHQAQEKLRVENESLRQQVAQWQTDNDSLSNRLAAVGDPKSLSDEQFNELLKLRGEVGMLRNQVIEIGKLREENRQISRELADATQTLQSLPSPEQALFNKKRVQAVNDAKMVGLAMRIWAGDNNDQYPTNFEDMTNELGGVTNVMHFKEAFEFVNAGVANEHYPQMLMLREITPLQAPDGKWERAYGFADGSVQTITSNDGNFDDWEKQQQQNNPPPPNQ